MDDLLSETVGGVMTITLNRPNRRNAFTLEMVDAWADALTAARNSPEVRAVMVTGAGDAFCAGIDLSVMQDVDPAPIARAKVLTDRIHAVSRALRSLDKPVLAAINGPAVGAGLDMALMCDMRFAARSARVSAGYVRVGLVPGNGGAYLLPRLIGLPRALELLLSGRFVDADEAARVGLVNRVCDDTTLVAEATAFAQEIAGWSPVAVSMTKRLVYESTTTTFETSLQLAAAYMGIVQPATTANPN
jgi:enoyl-CoA hydratase/carnithine racemase